MQEIPLYFLQGVPLSALQFKIPTEQCIYLASAENFFFWKTAIFFCCRKSARDNRAIPGMKFLPITFLDRR